MGLPTTVDRRVVLLLAVLPGLLLASLGLTHPAHLTADAARWWRDLHVVALVLFPLLGVGPWVVARTTEGPAGSAWSLVVGVLCFVFACFYTALDVLSGIGAGALKVDGEGGLATLFRWGGDLGDVGAGALLAAVTITSGRVWRVAGARALPGVALVLLGTVGFWRDHIYPPWGAASMAAIAAGLAILALVTPPTADPVDV